MPLYPPIIDRNLIFLFGLTPHSAAKGALGVPNGIRSGAKRSGGFLGGSPLSGGESSRIEILGGR